MATKKTPRSTSASRSPATTKRVTKTKRRTSSSALQPRRRASRPGLPTTVGAALGTLVVTTLLELSWPVRLGLVVLVLVVGLAYVLWKHRGALTAGASVSAEAAVDASTADLPKAADPIDPASRVTDPPAPSSGQ